MFPRQNIPAACAFILFLLLQSGCAVLRPSGDPAGYGGRGLNYQGVDFSVLVGKKIVLDPGHGGRFSGAVGVAGLTEKDVNLSVALILRDLLTGYGAEVVMTRQSDVDLLPEGQTGPLHDDLKARTDTANADSGAVLFLSLHHNNLGTPDRGYNATETYYKMSDPGPSLDLARYLHRQLVRNVGLPRNFIRPGNYYVLRNNNQPAVLGEASYLSHPQTEKKLLGENARRIEAYAYLLGIVDYLSGGVPVAEDLRVAGASPVQEACPQLSARVYDESGSLGIDPQQIELALDGEVLPVSYDPASGALRARPAVPLSNGRHEVALRVRNLRGNAARECRLAFEVAVPPAWIRLGSSLGTIPLDGRTPVRLTATVSDLLGRPAGDSTEVLFQFSDPNLPTRSVPTHGGAAAVTVTPAVNRPLSVLAACGNVSAELSVPVGEPYKSILVVQTLRDDSEEPLGGVKVLIRGAGLYETDQDGFLSLEGLEEGEYPLRFELKGYRPAADTVNIARGSSRVVQMQLQPAAGGVLLGRKIALDPEDGLAEAGETGMSGTREADVNQAVAELLADYLERAGAEVFFTHSTEESPGVWERAIRTESFGPDLLVSLSHGGRPGKKGPPPATAVHYYSGSTEGERLAREIAAGLKGFAGMPFGGAAPGYERIVQQVACPAVWVRAASVADSAAEIFLSAPAGRRQEALAIFTGLLRYYGWSAQGTLAGRLSDGRGNLVSGALVILDGWLPVQSDETGRFLFAGLNESPHQIEVFHKGKAFGPYRAEAGRNLELLLGAL